MRALIIAIGLATLIPVSVSAQDVLITVLSVHASEARDPAALKSRIKAAIDKGCGVLSANPYDQWIDIARCRKQAWQDTDRQLERLRDLKGEGVELTLRGR